MANAQRERKKTDRLVELAKQRSKNIKEREEALAKTFVEATKLFFDQKWDSTQPIGAKARERIESMSFPGPPEYQRERMKRHPQVKAYETERQYKIRPTSIEERMRYVKGLAHGTEEFLTGAKRKRIGRRIPKTMKRNIEMGEMLTERMAPGFGLFGSVGDPFPSFGKRETKKSK